MFKTIPLHTKKSHGVLALADDLGLIKGRVHEVFGTARTSFAGIVAAGTSGTILWIGREKAVVSIHPANLSQFFEPGRVLTITCLSRKEILWAAEQALKSKGTGCVVIELSMGPDLTESRRLQLASEEGGGVGLVLIEKRAQTSSAQTRWQCRPLPTDKIDNPPKWEWTLTKDKAGGHGQWQVTWTPVAEKGGRHAANYVRLVSEAAA